MNVENLFKALNLLWKAISVRTPPGIYVDSKMGVRNHNFNPYPSFLLD